MPRQRQTPQAREIWNDMVIHNARAWLYTDPTGYTSQNVPWADASPRYIGIPPVLGTLQPFSNRPSAVGMSADNDWHVSFDAVINTQNGAVFQGGREYVLALNPGVLTIGFVSVAGTGRIYGNWFYGD